MRVTSPGHPASRGRPVLRWFGGPSLLLAAALVATACSGSAAETGEAGSAPGDVPSGPGSSVDEPLTVVMAGDSVMEELYAPVNAAFGPEVDVRFSLQPELVRDTTQRMLWQSTIDGADPHVIAVLVGNWEQVRMGAKTVDALPPREEYLGFVVEPFLDLLTQDGAEVLWLEAPYASDQRRVPLYREMNATYAAAAAEHPGATFVQTNDLLAERGQSFSPVLPGPDGTPVRIRNADGNHVCPDGAVLVAERLVALLEERYDVTAEQGWQDGDWRTEPPFAEPEECPEPS